MRTVGWLVRNDKVVSIASERFVDDPETFRAVTHVLRSMVKEIRYL
jgi:hypothetical protein